ncbi:MAG: tripartite tricarboxylate transporter substrate binding protein [Comamonas sp.]|nr:tripartite tricarboxylate transporter substrate binding protein [Comamonas sp.]
MIRFARRTLLSSAAAAFVLAASPAVMAETAAWPVQPITMMMTFNAGSGVDVVARLIQEPVSKILGQPIIIDYKPGAAGNIASEYVSRAKPDGYTFVFGTAATHGTNAALYAKLPFDVEADFTPVSPVVTVSNVLTINPEVIKVNNLKEFVAEIKAHPGKYNFASTGNGTGTHMAFAELNWRLGLDMVHVPYKGGPDAITGVLRGETCCIMNQVQTVLPHVKSGKLKMIAASTAERIKAVPDVQPVAESGLPGTKNFDSAIWFGIFAPKNTPAPIVAKFNAAVQQALQQPEIRERLESTGNSLRLESPEKFKQTVHDNRKSQAEIVKAANIVNQ